MRTLHKSTLSIAVVSLLFSGCATLSPEYERPIAPIPSTLAMGVKENNQSVQELSWKAFIHDDRLLKVVAQSLEQSRDLRKAVANIEAARATYRIQRSSEFPTIEASAVPIAPTSADAPPPPGTGSLEASTSVNERADNSVNNIAVPPDKRCKTIQIMLP